MPFVSSFFSGNKRLAACQVNDAAHVLLGSKGRTQKGSGVNKNDYRGRDGHCCPPPAQIRTGNAIAYGSYFG